MRLKDNLINYTLKWFLVAQVIGFFVIVLANFPDNNQESYEETDKKLRDHMITVYYNIYNR
jgi:hypothetical protein